LEPDNSVQTQGWFFYKPGNDADPFISKLGDLMAGSAEQTMLTPGIRSSYQKGVGSRLDQSGVATVAQKTAEASCAAGARFSEPMLRLTWQTPF
jgi:hypothetical protein